MAQVYYQGRGTEGPSEDLVRSIGNMKSVKIRRQLDEEIEKQDTDKSQMKSEIRNLGEVIRPSEFIQQLYNSNQGLKYGGSERMIDRYQHGKIQG